MKPNEFRLGNYVEYDGRILRIDTIAPIFPTLNTRDYGIGVVDWNNIKPVKITDEFLIKLGFKKYQESDIPAYFKTFGSFLEDDYEYCFSMFQDIEENFYIQVMGKKIILNEVHKLQNIYFELTEEELTFKAQ